MHYKVHNVTSVSYQCGHYIKCYIVYFTQYKLYFTVWFDAANSSDPTFNYQIQNSTFYIKTESVTGSDDVLLIHLYESKTNAITVISVYFMDWRCTVVFCIPDDPQLKLTAVPTAVNKIWEVTTTPDELRIKCNGVEVFHFIYNDTYLSACNNRIKGKAVTNVLVEITNNAALLFSPKIGKYPCLFIMYSRDSTMHIALL